MGIFSETSMDGATSSLITKANLHFVSFVSTKNSSWLHMDMNLGFSSSAGFGAGGTELMITLFTLSREHIDVLFTSLGSINIVLSWSPPKNMTCVRVNHITSNNCRSPIGGE